MNPKTYQKLRDKIGNIYYETYKYEKEGDFNLEDVLVAMKKNKAPYIAKYKCEKCNAILSGKEITEEGADISGYWYEHKGCGGEAEIENRFLSFDMSELILDLWQLNIPLQSQSDETLIFLADLILNK